MSETGSILVTGAGGFVGRALTRLLRERFPHRDIVALAADVTDTAAIDAEVASVRPTACVHLAAIASVGEARRDTARVWRVNLDGTRHLAQAVMAHAPGCAFLFVSTADAYGGSFAAGAPLDETAPLAPLNPYAASKAAADLAVGALAADGLRAIRLRPFNHTGPGQSDTYVVAAFAAQVAAIRDGRAKPVLRTGNLDVARDFLDVRDVCDAYALAIERADALPPGTILNIASGTPRRVRDVLEALMRLAGVTATVEPDPARLRANDLPVAAGNASRARAMLEWAPSTAWEDTLRAMLEASGGQRA